ncbi:hypothetical protein AALO_G00201620 [Alosa alosa]|uniref:Dynein regulatory complex protein 9 n=1 Tax=Alosa alosa TaxID=278164 RepID=A0AAV6G5K3_9TELE|nr:dynein regulatory complex protein 9 [Alosa alosa]XP_048120089.1 dynein regulatory complex protein 9 [Alosa alosa]KAG5269402.1 hypothetical protein AALO_G00201620 [Alosa alosa]
MSVDISGAQLVRVCTVLQDCADKLAVLGNIMPDTYHGRPEADSVVGADISGVISQHREAEQSLKTVRQIHAEGGAITEAVQELHKSHKELDRTMETNPLSPDNLAKVQRDRQFLAEVIINVLAEVKEKGTIESLLLAVEEEKKKKAHLLDIIIREEEGRRRTKALQRQLQDIRKEKTLELQRREEMTAHLKDQLQEMKVKTSLERKYVKNSTELLVYQGQKLNTHQEKLMEDDIKLLQNKMEMERRAHMEMEIFLKENLSRLGEKLEYWMERYEKDMEDKQQELNTLKNAKYSNLAQLQDLAKKYRESEQVVIENRIEKENLRKMLEKQQMERLAATKIQSWWRGTMVRRGLGQYKKGKKGKDGKKGKKKKK